MPQTGGEKAAFIITGRADLGADLTEGLTRAGFVTSTISNFSALETLADVRPALVITDLLLQPTETQWNSIVRLFPHSVIWALVDPDAPEFTELVTAFRHGCQDCLLYPVADDTLVEKAEVLINRGEVRVGRLDQYIANEIRLDLPSDLSIVGQVVDLLATRCRDYRSYAPRTLIKLRIALSEALANAIHYGNAHQIGKMVQVRANVDAWGIRVQITDEGSGFDPGMVPDPTLPEALESPQGRGVFLLKQLADDVLFNEKGNSVTIVLASDMGQDQPREDTPVPVGRGSTIIELFEKTRANLDVELHFWEERPGGALEHIAPAEVHRKTASGHLRWLRTPNARYAIEAPQGDEEAGRWAEFTRELLETAMAHEVKLAEKKRELAQRQDEIELLHAVTETLGAATRVEDAAGPVLGEIVRVTGAERASLWIHDAKSDELVLIASEGPSPASVPTTRIPTESAWSISALAFRRNRTVRLSDDDEIPEEFLKRYSAKPDPWIAVPIRYTGPDGATRTIGVLNLIGRRGGSVISDLSETRLLLTLARQIGSAIESARLFEEGLAQERLIGELQLAHNLQMGLLPDLGEFAELVDAAARCVPAKTVGGDFYQMFRLPGGKIGVMIGDITSHGFGASLIMALVMSATGIYAAETTEPAEMLKAIHRSLIHHLESTETFVTMFYGVIDPRRRLLSYSNAGHAHAFRMHELAAPQRLDATSPPLGVGDYEAYTEEVTEWESADLLCLFTDGLTTHAFCDTESALVDAVSEIRDSRPREIIDRMFEVRERYEAEALDDQTALVLRLRG